MVLELWNQRLSDAVSRGHDAIADELVFPSQTGTVLDVTNLIPRHFLLLLERARLRRVRFHDLRRTFGSLLIQAHAPLTYVRDQMGHSSIKITADIYGHMVPGADVAYVDRLDSRPKDPRKSANPRKQLTGLGGVSARR